MEAVAVAVEAGEEGAGVDGGGGGCEGFAGCVAVEAGEERPGVDGGKHVGAKRPCEIGVRHKLPKRRGPAMLVFHAARLSKHGHGTAWRARGCRPTVKRLWCVLGTQATQRQ
ncbi:hypothetical protein GCM10017581_020090 [Dactylosporangium matsuzakiense]|uniref:Uncharacterized protein n=1 Tax=Dactylosporangium matsuzakiense TaxID=53360 RepID=A0A9W6NKG3_9ACTN|nr:hypothetical protein GCM10017581_020090 [Dactylosporangium matsuzakiense]